MTDEQIKFVLERLGKVPQREIARMVGVSACSIAQLKRKLAAKSFAASLPADKRRNRIGGKRKWE